MASSQANLSRAPSPSNEAQDTSAGHQRDEDDAADAGGDDAESVDSNVTTMPLPESLLRDAEDVRQRKIRLAGKPTRPIREYSKELELKRPVIWSSSPMDLQFYREYALNERRYFDYEVTAWGSFVRHIRFTWQKDNDLAGGTFPPSPPLLEIDLLELHTP